MGRMSLVKLTVAPPAAGCVAASVAGASVATGSVGASVAAEVSVGASVAGAAVSVGADVAAGASVGGAPQADNKPTIKANKAIFTYVDFILYLLLKKI